MTKPSNDVSAAPKKVKWEGFANVKLPPSISLESLQDHFDNTSVEDALDALLEDGYKVSVTRDYDSGARIVTITGQYAHCPNAGLSCSTWAGSIEGGVWASLWKSQFANGTGVWTNGQTGAQYEI